MQVSSEQTYLSKANGTIMSTRAFLYRQSPFFTRLIFLGTQKEKGENICKSQRLQNPHASTTLDPSPLPVRVRLHHRRSHVTTWSRQRGEMAHVGAYGPYPAMSFISAASRALGRGPWAVASRKARDTMIRRHLDGNPRLCCTMWSHRRVVIWYQTLVG
ncbi:hypothetical protein SODALDRAFT_59975 [Sodiomyces alkalinus F11]|uniref:Uncharacterized protein n=1 Tax=Sodiomyces alkalinus (strain CBS 110278 / VKM F-3762 / F11) TaxID=1314773 RepID=A0A3N2PL92_SODAK|nr:hypothetical protein SODALDRAFT_59975 [Sodiomyces alkalinus F11]ROT35259.1 hypothetical protein SODALDRAFT_59975 [Sodiomyces alkalinus F11]